MLGIRSIEELVGRTDLLAVLEGDTGKQRHLDLSPLLYNDQIPAGKPHTVQVPRNKPYDEGLLAERMVAELRSAIENKSGGEFTFNVTNCDRSIGARLSPFPDHQRSRHRRTDRQHRSA